MPGGRVRVAFAVPLAPLLVAGAALLPARPAAAAVPVIVIQGRGFGHGVGMAQDGALAMGRQGASLERILGQFYPGVSLAHATGDVRVPVLSAPGQATIAFPDGGQITDATSGTPSAGFPVAVPAGDMATVTWSGTTYSASVFVPGAPAPSTTTPGTRPSTTAPTTTTPTRTTAPPFSVPLSLPHRAAVAAATAPAPAAASSGRPLWAQPAAGGVLGLPARERAYRGMIEVAGIPGTLRLINQVDVETYLQGMGEVLDPSWPLASLEAQEVAARTYALRAMATGGEICDDTRCQVYLGVGGEYPAAARAVTATAGTVMVYDGHLVDAVYSANAAGFSASRLEGFGSDDDGAYPYLRAAPYPATDPDAWQLEATPQNLVARLGLSGALTNLAVATRGPSGRALTMTVTAGGHTTAMTGLAFAAALGLRSTMIDSIRAVVAATAPPPLSGGSLLQVSPDNASQVAAAASAHASTSTTTGPDTLPAAPTTDANQAAPARHGHDASVPPELIFLAVLLVGVVVLGATKAAPRKTPPS